MGRRVPGQPRGRGRNQVVVLCGAAGTDRAGGCAVDTGMIFMDCPAYMDERGTVRCGLPAEVEYRYAVRSSDGPLESARIRCPRGHWFNGPVESLTWDRRAGGTVLGAAGRKQDAASPPGSYR
jgi:hypothetical protein